jgi:Na+/melibiose symporter-like transporter
VDTLLGLKGILTIVPLIGLVISALVISRYKISTKYHKYILEKLKVSRNK